MILDRPSAGTAVLAMAVGWLTVTCLAPPSWAEEKPVIIRAVEGLRFDPPRLRVEAGTELRVQFENADTTAQPHNLVIARPGAREAVLAAALALGAEGPARGYLPSVPEVVAGSRLLAAGEKELMVIRVPQVGGVYPLVCTFPGHGVIMFGALYVGEEMPARIEDDPHVPKPPPTPVLAPDPRPMVRRVFLPDSGPASIAVALPGDLNLCWDAGACRLRYAWRGGFLDAEKHFEGKGQALARLGGPVVMTAPKPFPVRVGGRESKAIAFRGYVLECGLPVFEYTVDNQLIKEGFSADGNALIRRFQVVGLAEPLEISTALESSGIPTPSRGTLTDGVLRLTAGEAVDVTLRYPPASAHTPPQ